MNIEWQFETFYIDSDGYHTETCFEELPPDIVDAITDMFTVAHTDHNGMIYQCYPIYVRVLVNKSKNVWSTEVFIGSKEKEKPWLEFSASSAKALAEKYDYLKYQIKSAKI